MASYGQQTAYRVQETEIFVFGTGWVVLEGSTALSNRFATKVFSVGSAGATRLGLKYMDSDGTAPAGPVKTATHWLGAGQFVVEPNATGLKLYGRAKLATGISTIRVKVTEYGS